MKAVSSRVNRKNDHILTRSANAPDTIEAAVATKTIWKNQSDIVEWPFATTEDTAPSSSANSAISPADGPRRNVNEPITEPTSTYMRL